MSQPVDRFLSYVERAGNRLPHPTLLFIWLCGFVLLASAVASALGVSTSHPTTGELLSANNLLSGEGVARILQNTVSNFTSFAPVGTVLIAMLGLGVAERSGLISNLLSGLVQHAKGHGLTFTVVFAGVMSSLAADAGYVVLIPLAAIIFQQAGRHPLAGIAAAFAGVSGGYSANLLLGPFDAVLSGISTAAAQLIDPSMSVSVAANYWFMLVSVFVVSTLATWVTARWVEPRLSGIQVDSASEKETVDATHGSSISLSGSSSGGLKAVGIFTVLFVLVVASGLVSESSWLRQGKDVISSPFMKGIVVVISIYALLSGYIYGRVSGRWRSGRDLIEAMEASMATMAGYLVLMFFAAQFVAYFAWSNLGIILAVQGADLLSEINAPAPILLVVFIFVAALINLFVGSGSAKWALLAPVFVPMLMLVGIPPEATQVAFRIGDSSTNIITPLMPYFGVVLAFAQHYKKELGMGTVISMMLPYSVAFMLGWTLLLIGWLLLGWPLGW
ncbi:AbgT family transporter [Thalassolituus maritimus]|uniref:AbgT family transporter n=1 Tax=Thalassolituus maritimus TaxID=484498 RepID=A0ABP9ZY50_9GAMM